MAALSSVTTVVGGGVPKFSVNDKKFSRGNCVDDFSRSRVNVARFSSSAQKFPIYPRVSKHRPSSGFSKCRWSHDGQTSTSTALSMGNNPWKKNPMFPKGRVLATPSEDRMLRCCNHIHNRKWSYPKCFSSRFTADISTFPLSNNLSKNICAKKHRAQCSAVGPDEPHAVSTSWPEEVLEKPRLDFLENEVARVEVEEFLNVELPSHPKLYRGQLKNGLRYIILPNKVPPNRFEAHMELHVGSIDEEDDEQGIAHMIEHVAFLGSKKREKLLGTGARSNAYTDFHHTVFHIHSQNSSKGADGDLLPSVLDALNEIAFHPNFLASRVEKERRAILSELQMMNTIEYRVDCQLLQHLHSENKLSERFPIGLEEQIKKWDVDKVRKFHERWYFPANATLYIVGDIDNISKIIYQIEAVFNQADFGNETEASPLSTPNAFSAMASFLVPKLSVGLGGIAHEKTSGSDRPKIIKKERHAVRPPVQHNWSLPGTSSLPDPPQIFQHELLQNFSFNMFCKVPVDKVRTYGDLRNVLMKRIVLSALHFRINSRYKSSDPPFTAVELDHSDSGREGCTVTTLTVTAEPRNWRDAIKVAVLEVRRLKEFGVTKGELVRYRDALLKDSEHLASMIDNIPSVDNLDFIMESDALGHKVMDQLQGHECLAAVAGTITQEEVNSIGAQVLEFISDFGTSTAPAPAAVVSCVPKKVHIDGFGETEFKISQSEISEAIRVGLEQPIEAEPELEVPKDLINSLQLNKLRMQHNPAFIPLAAELGTKLYDKETGITQRRLSNGIPVNYKISRHESQSGVMRLIVGGGRAVESSSEKGSVVVGVRTLSEGGRVGNFSREQVELFCVNHLINCSLESTEEFICMEFRFTLRDNGMRAAFQLLHMVLEHSVWMDDAFDRARQLYLSYYRSIPKSLERSTAHKLMTAMLNGDERFVEPTPESLQKLTLQSVKEAVMNQFVGDNMEVSIVGDFSEEEIESCILDFLGTISATRDCEKPLKEVIDPITFRPTSDMQSQQVFLKDTDERACAYIAGPAPNRWGLTVDGVDLLGSSQILSRVTGEQTKSEVFWMERSNKLPSQIQGHPLFFGITMGLLAEIINSRLFTTVRDSLGLTYDVSFELNLFDRLNFGWYVISVTSTPGKVHRAVDACKNVLRDLHNNKITARELDRAKRTLLMKHEAEIKANAYWLGLLAHLQAPSVPGKDLSCIKDLSFLYESATIEDVYLAYEQLKVDEDSLYSCIGIAGVQAGDETLGSDALEVEESIAGNLGIIPAGRGLSTMTRPTT